MTPALQQSSIRLTWDDTDTSRVKAMRKRWVSIANSLVDISVVCVQLLKGERKGYGLQRLPGLLQ